MAKPLAFFCAIPPYEELCDMFDGKVMDYAEPSRAEAIAPLSRGRIEIVEVHSAEPGPDGVWVTVEIRAPDTHGLGAPPKAGVTISEDDLKFIFRAPDDSEEDWIMNGEEPSGISEADV
jgi:hypothetical protein